MGAGASAAALIEAERQRPLDASDVDSVAAAKDEVVRLRLLLAAHTPALLGAAWTPQQELGDEREVLAVATSGEPQCAIAHLESGQQTEEEDGLRASWTDLGWEASALGCGDDAATDDRSSAALAPGIQEYLIACFTNADLDHSGVLSAYEFSRLLREHVDLGLSPEDVQLLLGQAKWMDARGDVTWQQFVQLAPQLLANLVDTSAPSQPSDWCSCITPEGTPYYYNKRTQESAWDKPEELQRAATDPPLSTQAALDPDTLSGELEE
ncbi:hypothetical protein PybrP1_002996 [[Pythium] brassicae (nom. inval.)]|nr:hypothetical protein PybrP1_002996 [[Pythium] brassicae (nom. inval.)]